MIIRLERILNTELRISIFDDEKDKKDSFKEYMRFISLSKLI